MFQSRALRTALTEAALLLLIVDPARSQSKIAEQRVNQFSVQNISLPQAAMQLAFKLHIPIGVENIPGTELKFDFSAEATTLRQALNGLVQKNSLYRWKEIRGVIDIFPARQPNSVFDVVIHQFSIEGVASLTMIQEVLKTKEITTYLNANRLSAGTWMVGSVPVLKRGSLTLRDETLREALNDTVTQTQSRGWASNCDPRGTVKHLWFQAW